MQFCADVRAICRKRQTSNFEWRGQGRGGGFFCSLKLPYLSTISTNNFFSPIEAFVQSPPPLRRGTSVQRPNLTANGYFVQTSSLTNAEVRETNFTIIYHQASYTSGEKKFFPMEHYFNIV